MTQNLPVIVLFTSKQCGHCAALRGEDGSLKPIEASPTIYGNNGKGYSYNEKFFQLLLRGGLDKGPQRFRVYNVHFTTLQPESGVEEFSEFSLTPEGKVKRTTYSNVGGNFTKTEAIGYKQFKPRPVPVTDRKYDDVLLKTIPKSLGNYAGVYPGWIFADGIMWNKALTTGESFYAYPSSLKVVKNNGIYSIDRRREAIGKPEDPVQVGGKILSGEIKFVYNESPVDKPTQITRVTGCRVPEFQLLPM